ncbi:hypothetical protein [Aliivibrio wodanis]|uniref:hypothetical protein n=1 Tax=Aliivibrio wodanis TaxID=80852 RepID=UPI00406C5270
MNSDDKVVVETIHFEDYIILFNGKLSINAEYCNENHCIELIVSSIGYDSQEKIIKRGHRGLFVFDFTYEIKVLKISSNSAVIQVSKISSLNFTYVEYINETLGVVFDSDEGFTLQEKNELKEKLSTLEKEFADHCKCSREEAAFAKASFELLIKKLDDSSKTSWKQSLLGIGSSIALSISPENIQTAIDTSSAALEYFTK